MQGFVEKFKSFHTGFMAKYTSNGSGDSNGKGQQ